MVKVSVIVPIYNSEKYLKRCVDSLINQTMCDIEFILINDGSEDESLSVIRKLEKEDARIRVVDKEHSGLSRGQNGHRPHRCAGGQGLRGYVPPGDAPG